MGVASGAGPIAGIYGAIFVGFFAAIFGGTPAQVSGPTGPMTVVLALIITQYTALYPGDPETGTAMALTDMVNDTLAKRDRYVFFVGLRPNVQAFLEKQGVLDKVDSSHIYTERHSALCHAARVIDIDPDACKPD